MNFFVFSFAFALLTPITLRFSRVRWYREIALPAFDGLNTLRPWLEQAFFHSARSA